VAANRAHDPAAAEFVTAGRCTAELYAVHGRMVYAVCRLLLRDPTDAEDAAQQTFLSAHTALLRGARLREPGAWLATIARNECRSRIAARMREPLPLDPDRLQDVPDAREEDLAVLGSVEIRAALAELPQRQQEAVVLRDVFGLRYVEVGTALGASIPAVEALLVRARRTLRGRLRPALGSVLVLPANLREELETALPGFAGAASGGSLAGLAAIGGAFAKLTGGPTAAKLAATVVAVGAVGSAAVVGGASVDGSSRSLDRTIDRAPLASASPIEGAAIGRPASYQGSGAGEHRAILISGRSWRTAARRAASSGSEDAMAPKRTDSDGPDGSQGDGSTPARGDPPEPYPEPSAGDDDGSQNSDGTPSVGDRDPTCEEPSDDDDGSSGPGSGDGEPNDRSGPSDLAEESDDDRRDDDDEHEEDGSPQST
jgi:RNA polymerase sigma-70 factor, ECF subfamily